MATCGATHRHGCCTVETPEEANGGAPRGAHGANPKTLPPPPLSVTSAHGNKTAPPPPPSGGKDTCHFPALKTDAAAGTRASTPQHGKQNSDAMENDAELSPALVATISAIEERLTSKLGSMIETAMDQILIKVMTAVPAMISKHIMDNPRLLRRLEPVKDVSRPSKFNCLINESENEDNCPSHSVITPLSLPAVIALQEPGLGAALTNYTTFQQDPASCLLVHKAYTANLMDLDLQLEYSYVMATILPLRRRDPPLHVLKVYCSPKLKRVILADLFCRALSVTGRDLLLIVGNFNALSQLWGLVRRWRRQKHNTKLKARISELTQRAAEYAAQLADSTWVDRCNTAARQMSSRNTWRLFQALIDPTQTRTEIQKHLQRAVHAFPGNTTQLAQKLRDQYLCTAQGSRRENTELDQPFQLHDLRVALAKMKRGTAPGKDKVTVKLLVNLPDTAYHQTWHPSPRILGRGALRVYELASRQQPRLYDIGPTYDAQPQREQPRFYPRGPVTSVRPRQEQHRPYYHDMAYNRYNGFQRAAETRYPHDNELSRRLQQASIPFEEDSLNRDPPVCYNWFHRPYSSVLSPRPSITKDTTDVLATRNPYFI
ncbi:hypothetical protein HPB49_001748 [Dermacentor silvarum]|uniref:Uncharacterized protein n=1 Tax=Dermacentor silvarum TaxID=543639 RepID=A0ACB8D225_DERSI|nr:hypothetical protein HPB49_001748 [Dermacentor silvarum]